MEIKIEYPPDTLIRGILYSVTQGQSQGRGSEGNLFFTYGKQKNQLNRAKSTCILRNTYIYTQYSFGTVCGG